MQTNCPLCRAPIEAGDRQALDCAVSCLTPRQRRLVSVLWSTAALIEATDLAALVYDDDPQGGPDHATWAISRLARLSRPTLRRYGWDIEGVRGKSGGYRLSKNPAGRKP